MVRRLTEHTLRRNQPPFALVPDEERTIKLIPTFIVQATQVILRGWSVASMTLHP